MTTQEKHPTGRVSPANSHRLIFTGANSYNYMLGDLERADDAAAFIVKAVNNHDSLYAALMAVSETWTAYIELESSEENDASGALFDNVSNAISEARAALAQVEGK